MNTSNRKYFLDRHPWLPGGLTIAYVLFGLTVPMIFIYFPSTGDEAPRFLHFVSFVLISAPITLTVLQILTFKRSKINIRHLAILYLEIILMFGVIYFYAVSSRNEIGLKHDMSPESHIPAIRGIDADWVDILKTEHNTDEEVLMKKMLICFQDCIHFSLITSTTVGYGDMVPNRPMAKFLVDIQVLVSFFLISFGVAGLSSSRRRKDFNEDLKEIEERLKAIEETQS